MPDWLSSNNAIVLIIAGAFLLLLPSPGKTLAKLLQTLLAKLGLDGQLSQELSQNAEQAAYVAAFLTLRPKLSGELQEAVWRAIMPPADSTVAKP